MTQFKFTDTEKVVSSAVEQAFYNAQTKQLAVVLHGGATYVYDNVPAGAYDTLTDHRQSAGHFYATSIKPNYGPGEYLGYDAVDPDEDKVEAASVTARIDLTVAPERRFNLVTEKFIESATASTAVYPVSVDFTVEGHSTVKTYNTKSETAEGGVRNLLDAVEILGIEVAVKKATITFE